MEEIYFIVIIILIVISILYLIMKNNDLEKKLRTSTEKFGPTDNIEANNVQAHGLITAQAGINTNGLINAYAGINTNKLSTNEPIKVGNWILHGSNPDMLYLSPNTTDTMKFSLMFNPSLGTLYRMRLNNTNMTKIAG